MLFAKMFNSIKVDTRNKKDISTNYNLVILTKHVFMLQCSYITYIVSIMDKGQERDV